MFLCIFVVTSLFKRWTIARLVFRLRWTWAAARNMTKLSDIIAGQPDSCLLLESLPLDQNAKLFVTDLRALLKSDLVRTFEHQRRNYERNTLSLFPGRGDGEIKTAPIFSTFKTQIPNVLLRLFHIADHYT